jgi:glycosyltransferase involved in cell wall biosynthesis
VASPATFRVQTKCKQALRSFSAIIQTLSNSRRVVDTYEQTSDQHHRDRTLLVISHPAVLPVNQLVYAQLARRGWCVDLITPARWRHEYAAEPFDAQPLPELAERFHPRRVLFAGSPQRHLYLANPLADIRRLRPSVVFCEQEPFSVPAAQWGLAARALGVPFGVQMAENLDRRLPRPARAIMAAVLPRAVFVAARSETAGALARRWGARGEVRLIPHHVPGWPLPSRPVHEAFTVGFAGRLVPEKGLDTLVDAIRRLDPPVELLVAGDGPLRGWLESADLGSARLRIVRGTDHAAMASVYAEMDVLALPSRTTPGWTEQFGRVLVEALWCGTPVIGSDSGEIPWVIETTGGGLVFPEGDDSVLAERLQRLRSDDGLRRDLTETGRSRVIEMFSVEGVADRLQETLRTAVESRRQHIRA